MERVGLLPPHPPLPHHPLGRVGWKGNHRMEQVDRVVRTPQRVGWKGWTECSLSNQ